MRLAGAVACALTVGAALQPPAATPPEVPGGATARDLVREQALAAKVQPSIALANVRELVALGPRLGGTPSGKRAARLLAGKMRDLGLAVEVLIDPPMKTHVEKKWQVLFDGKPLASAWPYNFSPPVARTTARLELLPAGTEQPSKDLEGAFVLTSSPVGPEASLRMARAGAVALLTDAPADPNRYVDWAPIGSVEREGADETGVALFGLSYRDGRRLRDALAAASAPVHLTIELESETFMGRPRTVVGTLSGAGRMSNEILIVCAHGDSDSGGPGADDNASGVASLVEVARALTGAAAEGALPADRPSVKFIIWGAEYHSSKAWVVEHRAEIPRIRAVINYDETGTGAERDAVYYEGNDIPWNENLLRTIEAVADDHAGRLGFPTAWTSNPALGGTDAYTFLPRDHGGEGLTDVKVPSTTVFSGAWDKPTRVPQTAGWKSKGWPEQGDLFIDYSAFYHSSGDTPANTTEAEPWNMERCAKLVTVALYRIMSQSAPPRR